jgi:hypothetical protein
VSLLPVLEKLAVVRIGRDAYHDQGSWFVPSEHGRSLLLKGIRHPAHGKEEENRRHNVLQSPGIRAHCKLGRIR